MMQGSEDVIFEVPSLGCRHQGQDQSEFDIETNSSPERF